MGFGVVSLSLGNPRFPFRHGLIAYGKNFGELPLGEFFGFAKGFYRRSGDIGHFNSSFQCIKHNTAEEKAQPMESREQKRALPNGAPQFNIQFYVLFKENKTEKYDSAVLSGH